uniref:Uncharacterized protein n=1 Tax=viral metagenome TaxID=1070528 RepID=A0A6C0L2U6_9ZZZZ|tara:strand:- start:26434 stop:26802 length:369 start_codon:yes stop_codon:yes gene_type:complete
MDQKRIYIHQNINKINDHVNIINIIEQNECKHTKNNNGIFLNLTTTEDDIVDQIYFLLNNELNYSIINENDMKMNDEELFVNRYTPKQNVTVSPIINEPLCNQFTPSEQERILYSKLYHLKI